MAKVFRPGRPSGCPRPVVVALISALTAITMGACSADERRSATPDLAHIHGLGINPADGELYVGSHHGVFRVPEGGEPEQITGRTQDFMGFTITGPDHFLGSGHPGPGERDQPPHVGLIESVDGAQTWRSLSLSGQADFHAIEAKHDRVYGLDSQTGQLLVSSDRQSWDARARGEFIDVAVSPDDAEDLLATTTRGAARSMDGGRTFVPVDSGPALLLIDWSRPDHVLGVAPDGVVYASEDRGARWRVQGQVPGGPSAMTTHGDSEVYVATRDAIHRSRDGGATFGVLLRL